MQNVLLLAPVLRPSITPRLMMMTQPDQDLGHAAGDGSGCRSFWVGHFFVVTRLFYNRAHQSAAGRGGLKMRTLREYVRLYFMIEAQYIKARMHYRADFIISSIGMFFSQPGDPGSVLGAVRVDHRPGGLDASRRWSSSTPST